MDQKISQFKEKIREKPIQYLDLLFDLVPENILQAETIVKLLDELVKEKKVDHHFIYQYMEKPLYFQDASHQDFYRREPLIAKLVREGGLLFFNYYLHYKYGSALSAELVALHPIFVFNIPPITHYIDQTHTSVFATKDDKARISKKYYAFYGMTYELFSDILQDKSLSIVKHLAESAFDFNQLKIIDYVKKYINTHPDVINITTETLLFLLEHGLRPECYLELFLTGWCDGFYSSYATHINDQLIYLSNFLLDHGAKLDYFSREFLEKLQSLLENYHPNNKEIIEEIAYLKAHNIEAIFSLEKAKPYYLKAGIRGSRTLQRKILLNLLETVKGLS